MGSSWEAGMRKEEDSLVKEEERYSGKDETSVLDMCLKVLEINVNPRK